MDDQLLQWIERSDRWIKDATERQDWNDVCFYEGQKKAFEEVLHLRSIILISVNEIGKSEVRGSVAE